MVKLKVWSAKSPTVPLLQSSFLDSHEFFFGGEIFASFLTFLELNFMEDLLSIEVFINLGVVQHQRGEREIGKHFPSPKMNLWWSDAEYESQIQFIVKV